MKKTIIGVILSIIATIVGVTLNFTDTVWNPPVNIKNLTATIIFLFFWVLLLFISYKSKNCKSIIYFCVFWISTFIVSALTVYLRTLELNSGALYPIAVVFFVPFIAPFYGIRYIIDNFSYLYIAVATISFIMSATGVLLLIHSKHSVKKIKA